MAPPPETPGTDPGSELRVFINYRRRDTVWLARTLHDRLAQTFGEDNVFLDLRDLAQPGMRWRDEIEARGAAADVLIALIGAKWLDILNERLAQELTEPDEVQKEIELALSRGSAVEIIPVVADDAAMPKASSLPPSLQRLPDRQYVRLGAESFDQDVDGLINALRQIASRPPPPPAPAPAASAAPPPTAADEPAETEPQIAGPDRRHYRAVSSYLLQGPVTTVLGPQAGRLSAELSAQFMAAPKGLDLAEAAQRVFAVAGRPDLYRALRQSLTATPEPSAVHHFLARLPGILEQLGATQRYQLIVTTNYDNELERAFDAVPEPYDLAVYMSNGAHAGRFVHFPYSGGPETITSPNSYNRFPINVEQDRLARTVIVKIHGAVDGGSGNYQWQENYVITEDHYIDYLSTQPVECFVPTQILTQLRHSHCLFLGYPIRDWSHRVFMKRIWNGQWLEADSWAVAPDPGVLDRKLWSQYQVELFASPLDEYANRMAESLPASRPSSA